jgi:hypothetical protein
MPVTPGTLLWVGPDGGPFTVVSSSNPLPVSANAGTGTYTVAGTVLSGNVPSGGPVFVGGYDGTDVRAIATNTGGNLIPGPPSSTGLLKYKKQNLQGTQAIKATAGTLYNLAIVNTTAAIAYVQLFDAATGSVTLGTTVPDWEVAVPASSSVGLAQLANAPAGIPFGTAISVAATTALDGATTIATGLDLFAVYQ